MSATTSDTSSSAPAPRTVGHGAVIISAIALFIFMLAIVASGLLAWIKNDWGLVGQMAMIAATNATTVVGYWVGSSRGDDKKTDLLAQSPPIPAPKP